MMLKPCWSAYLVALVLLPSLQVFAMDGKSALISCEVESKELDTKTCRPVPSSVSNSQYSGQTVQWKEGDVSFQVLLIRGGGTGYSYPALTLNKVTTSKGTQSSQEIDSHEMRTFMIASGGRVLTTSSKQVFQIASKTTNDTGSDTVSTTLSSDADVSDADEETVTERTPTTVHAVTKTLGASHPHNGLQILSSTRTCDSKTIDFSAVSSKGPFGKIKPRLVKFDVQQGDVLTAQKNLDACVVLPTRDQCLSLRKLAEQKRLIRDHAWTALFSKNDLPAPRPIHHSPRPGYGGGSSSGGGGSSSSASDDTPPGPSDVSPTQGGNRSCTSHGDHGHCDSWSDGTSCTSHGENGHCDSWSDGRSCTSHGEGGNCDSWSDGRSCTSHGAHGSCDSWSDGNSCTSHSSNGDCDSWSDGSSCTSHNSDGSCDSWNR